MKARWWRALERHHPYGTMLAQGAGPPSMDFSRRACLRILKSFSFFVDDWESEVAPQI